MPAPSQVGPPLGSECNQVFHGARDDSGRGLGSRSVSTAITNMMRRASVDGWKADAL
jgi:hypothetical protein